VKDIALTKYFGHGYDPASDAKSTWTVPSDELWIFDRYHMVRDSAHTEDVVLELWKLMESVISLGSDVDLQDGWAEIANNATIAERGTYALDLAGVAGPDASMDGPHDIAYESGDYAFVAASVADVIASIDVSDPTNPSVVSTLALGSSPRYIEVVGTHAFVVDFTDDSVTSVDISDPANMSVVSTLTSQPDFGGPRDTALSDDGNHLFIGSTDNELLTSIDISDPANMSVADTRHAGYVTAIEVQGSYAYTCDYTDDRVRSHDVSDPTAITLIDTISDATYLDRPEAIAISTDGNNVYVGVRNGYVTTLDTSDPSNMSRPGSHAHTPTAKDLTVLDSGTMLAATGSGDELQVWDISGSTAVDASAFSGTDWEGVYRVVPFGDGFLAPQYSIDTVNVGVRGDPGTLEIRTATRPVYDDWGSHTVYLHSTDPNFTEGWEFSVGSGTMQLLWRGPDGENNSASATVDLSGAAQTVKALRVTAQGGASGMTINFYEKSTTPEDAHTDVLDDTGWTQVGTEVVTGHGGIDDATDALHIGVRAKDDSGSNDHARHYANVMYDAPGDANPIVDIDFTAQADGATSFNEAANSFTVTIEGEGELTTWLSLRHQREYHFDEGTWSNGERVVEQDRHLIVPPDYRVEIQLASAWDAGDVGALNLLGYAVDPSDHKFIHESFPFTGTVTYDVPTTDAWLFNEMVAQAHADDPNDVTIEVNVPDEKIWTHNIDTNDFDDPDEWGLFDIGRFLPPGGSLVLSGADDVVDDWEVYWIGKVVDG
jgi:hypothetical protein